MSGVVPSRVHLQSVERKRVLDSLSKNKKPDLMWIRDMELRRIAQRIASKNAKPSGNTLKSLEIKRITDKL